jgi:hypothetical protein
MYSTCLNENPAINNNPIALLNNSPLLSDSSMLNIDLSLLEAALKDVTSTNRSLTSSTTFASNQLIAAANAARSAQLQQQQQSISLRTTNDSGVHSAGAHSKVNAPLSTLASSIPNSSYPSLLQEVAHRSSSIVKLLNEVTKQQSCKTCGKDKTNNDTISLTDTQFLTPKAVDVTTSRVSFFHLLKKLFIYFNYRMKTIRTIMYIVLKVNYFSESHFYTKYVFLQQGTSHNTRRQKRRRPTDSGQSDEYDQKRLNIPSCRLSTSPSRSVCLSSSEDEPGLSLYHQELNKNRSNIIETPVQQPPSQSQRKRHQRKPTRLSNGITQQQSNISIKNESSTIDDNRSTMRKKPGLLLSTSGNSPNENFQWIHQAFRSIVPSTDVDLTIPQNSTSPQSSKN